MRTARKPWWQQATAVVSLSAGGAITGFSFSPKAPADVTSPTDTMVRLLAMKQPSQAAQAPDATLRSAIVNAATYYLRMAQDKTPAEMEQIIWQQDSIDGADHGESCAAFASLTLELAAQVVGQESWVTGGGSYPWPVHEWVDARVDPNPDSPSIVSVLQDAESQHRWHPLGDGYRPLPGDWVLFDGHVEVVTKYAGGVLQTIGGDSLPDFSVNSHEYQGSLAADGVVGFVNNGDLAAEPGSAPTSLAETAAGGGHAASGNQTGPNQASGSQLSGNQVSAHRAVAHGAAGHGAAGHRAAGSGAGQEQVELVQAAAGQSAIPGAALVSGPGVSGPAVSVAGVGAAGASATVAAGSASASASSGAAGGSAIPGVTAPEANQAQASRQPHTARQAHSSRQARGSGRVHPTGRAHATGRAPATGRSHPLPAAGDAEVPGTNLAGAVAASEAATSPADSTRAATVAATAGTSAIPGLPATEGRPAPASTGSAASGTASGTAASGSTASGSTAGRSFPTSAVHDTTAQQAFISEIAAGAMATQRTYGVPASVTIAQAIDESGWGQSYLSIKDHNLFGMKGAGPAGTDPLPSQEYQDGQWVTYTSLFRVYQDVAQSISDHGKLLATSGYYTRAMAERSNPDAFANALTGVYATDPGYGTKLISLMRRYDLYRYDTTVAPATARPVTAGGAQIPGTGHAAPTPAPSTSPQAGTPVATPAPRTSTPATGTPTPGTPTTTPTAGTPQHIAPEPTRTSGPAPEASASQPAGATQTLTATRLTAADQPVRERAAGQAPASQAPTSTHRYRQALPPAVRSAVIARPRVLLMRDEPLYRDVAGHSGIRWELLAACDWMQCEAHPRYSPVYGEKLGTPNPDGTCYRTRSAALRQCAADLVEMAWQVYQTDLTTPGPLSVRDLANAFAAFRWGRLLQLHQTSAMEFPYSVAGLTDAHLNMRWPDIAEPKAPDKPGTRFRRAFGAVPIVLGLDYPATA